MVESAHYTKQSHRLSQTLETVMYAYQWKTWRMKWKYGNMQEWHSWLPEQVWSFVYTEQKEEKKKHKSHGSIGYIL